VQCNNKIIKRTAQQDINEDIKRCIDDPPDVYRLSNGLMAAPSRCVSPLKWINGRSLRMCIASQMDWWPLPPDVYHLPNGLMAAPSRCLSPLKWIDGRSLQMCITSQIFLRLVTSSINRNQGYQLAPIYEALLSQPHSEPHQNFGGSEPYSWMSSESFA
jgi:hypothetical protein